MKVIEANDLDVLIVEHDKEAPNPDKTIMYIVSDDETNDECKLVIYRNKINPNTEKTIYPKSDSETDEDISIIDHTNRNPEKIIVYALSDSETDDQKALDSGITKDDHNPENTIINPVVSSETNNLDSLKLDHMNENCIPAKYILPTPEDEMDDQDILILDYIKESPKNDIYSITDSEIDDQENLIQDSTLAIPHTEMNIPPLTVNEHDNEDVLILDYVKEIVEKPIYLVTDSETDDQDYLTLAHARDKRAIDQNNFKIDDRKKTLRSSHCNLKTKATKGLSSHMQLRHQSKYSCIECKYNTNDVKLFKNHQRRHLMKYRFRCPKCVFRTNAKSFLLKHQKKGDCDMKKNQKKKVASHQKIQHRVKIGFLYTKCEFEALSNDSLNTENLTQAAKKKFCCLECNYSTKSEKKFAWHQMNNSGEYGSLHCDECRFKTNSMSHLNWHRGIHSNLKSHVDFEQFNCSQCLFITNSLSGLRDHHKWLHTKVTEIQT